MDKKPTNLTVGASKEDEKQKSENNNKQQQSVTTSTSLEKKSELILMKLQAIDSIEHSGLYKLSSDQRIYLKDQKKHLEEMLNKILRIYSATGNCTGWTDLKLKQTEYYEHKKVKLNLPHEQAMEAAMRQCAVKQLLFNAMMDATLCMHSKPATVTAPWEQEWSPPSYYPEPRQPEFGCDQLFPSVNSDVPAGPIARPVNRVETGQQKLQETSKPATVTAPWEQEWSPPSYYPEPRQPEFGCDQLFPSVNSAGPIARPVNRVETGQQTQQKLQETSKPATVTAPWEQEWSPPSYYPEPRQPEFGCDQLFPSVNSDVPAGPIARPVNRVETGQQTQQKLQETSKPATVTAPWEQEWSPPSYYPEPRQPEFGCDQLFPSVNSNVPAGPIARPVNRVETGQQTQQKLQETSQPVMPTSSGCPTCSLLDVDHDRELEREVEMYTMKWHAEETKASVKPTRLQQQNMSTPSGQNVDDFMEEIKTIRKRMNAFCSLRLPYSSQPELGSYKLFPSDPPCRPSHLAMSDVPESDVPARPTNTVEPGQQTQADISGDDVTRSESTAVMQSEEEVETNASTMACEPDQEDDDRELDLEVERYTTKRQAEEANASVEPATLQQNMSTPSGQNVDDDDVTRSVPTVVVESEKGAETNASTMACEPDQEDDDRELDLEVERYTTKRQAEEANASVEPATLQQNMSTPSGQNVDDDDVTRSVPTVVVESEKGAETNASTMAREPEQEDDGDQSPHPEEPSKDDA